MTVATLIRHLKQCDPDIEVYFGKPGELDGEEIACVVEVKYDSCDATPHVCLFN